MNRNASNILQSSCYFTLIQNLKVEFNCVLSSMYQKSYQISLSVRLLMIITHASNSTVSLFQSSLQCLSQCFSCKHRNETVSLNSFFSLIYEYSWK